MHKNAQFLLLKFKIFFSGRVTAPFVSLNSPPLAYTSGSATGYCRSQRHSQCLYLHCTWCWWIYLVQRIIVIIIIIKIKRLEWHYPRTLQGHLEGHLSRLDASSVQLRIRTVCSTAVRGAHDIQVLCDVILKKSAVWEETVLKVSHTSNEVVLTAQHCTFTPSNYQNSLETF